MDEFRSDHAGKAEKDLPLFGKKESNKKSVNDGKKKRLRREIESLHQEMEVTGYAKGKKGHQQRKVPRDISKIRTQKRRLLEKLDDTELAILGDEDEPENNDCDETDDRKSGMKRLRGSRVAAEDSVIQGSLIFSTASPAYLKKDDNCTPDKKDPLYDKTKNEVGKKLIENHEVDIDGGEAEDEDSDIDLCENGTIKTDDVEDESSKQSRNTPKQRKASKPSKSNGPSAKKRRKMYRLRNFQSLKMAQKHGSAIAAHARGQPRLAIEQLKAVAKAAPSAPQVYSSLGMVYEDMLRESRKRHQQHTGCSGDAFPLHNKKQNLEEEANNCFYPEGLKETLILIPHRDLADQRIIATKAYGSYHVAAILCKKDFTLWVRAADSALDIAEIHQEVINLPKLSEELCEYHRTERRRWQDEALRDYAVADNLKPPGIDVPAKLALVHMELGNLSEALTILTDLKNRAGYDFQSSYKAWMLYSDLMLRLGHECIQWSKGVQTNENYMFRRWLRKFSKIFDWQERRLQSLSLAFEAAAGTKNANGFLTWIRNRIIETTKHGAKSNSGALKSSIRNLSETYPQSDMSQAIESKEKLKINTDINEADHGKMESVHSEDEGMSIEASQLAKERKIMMLDQSRELEAFDKTTSEMNLMSESAAAEERKVVRNLLLKSHDAALSKLLKEYDQKESDLSLQTEESTEKIIGMNTSPLPISGSIRQVCSIASELMKHLLGLELYEGAKLVGDAVSCYMKERARRYHAGIEAKKKADEWQQKISDSPFFVDSYDDNNISSNEVDLSYLSDEETLLDDTEHSPLVKSLSEGALTPELRVLYGLALIGQGGRNFVAAKCLEAIDDLQQESEEWFSGESKTMHAVDSFWLLFRRAMTEELGRTGAYAFTADVLKKTKKEREWAFHFSTLFRNHLETLKDQGLIEKLLNLREGLPPNENFRKNQLLKVILEACKFDIYTIDERKEIKHALNRRPFFDRATQMRIAQDALASIVSVVPSVWSVEVDGVLPPICGEIVKVVAKCIRWLSSIKLKEIPYSALKNLVDQCTTIVSYLCGNSIPELNNIDESEMTFSDGTKTFPVQSSWQSAELRMISICAYNFAVACNVSLFSGWESEEFTMKILKRRCGKNRHFGVHIGDRRLAGCLPRTVEDELSRQWESMAKMQPTFPKLDFAGKMKIVKQSEWFQSESKSREETLRHGLIASHAEEEALELFLGYAAMCTQLSKAETDKRVSTRCQQLALSIFLPLSQFCLDETLWDSDIGEAATTLAGYEEWQILAGNTEYQPVGDREGLYPKRIRKSGKRVYDKKVQEWIEGVGSATSKDFLPIPNIELKRLWIQTTCEMLEETKTTDAKKQMQKVHKALADLRACYTYAAAEKSCLNISIALLEMAANPGCHDPFNCLQQAASFASQATKSGNSDTVYRQSLPETTQCSSREALIILGRADCLQAVYFPNEAAYLCSFVARVCRLHRDSREVNCEWNDRWKIVAIYAYNVSVMIRITVSSILDETMQKAFMSAWERDVVEELERARKDGRTWINTLTKTIGDASMRNVTEFDSSSDEIAENFTESSGTGQNHLLVQSDVKLLLQEDQALSPSLNFDSNIQFKPEELKEKVVQLLKTKIDECDEDSNSLNEIVQYSV